jgi:hypothetical protein
MRGIIEFIPQLRGGDSFDEIYWIDNHAVFMSLDEKEN